MLSDPLSAVGSGGEPSEVEGLSNCLRSGGIVCDIESKTQLVLAFDTATEDILLFARGGITLFVNVASSNGLHLKSFLYPPQVTLRLWHC